MKSDTKSPVNPDHTTATQLTEPNMSENDNEAIHSEFTAVEVAFGEGGIEKGEMTITPVEAPATGFPAVDAAIGGMKTGELVSVAGGRVNPIDAAKRGVTVTATHVDAINHRVHLGTGKPEARRRPHSQVRHVDHGPARGLAIAAALGQALAASCKTVDSFPKAPVQNTSKKKREDRRHFPKQHMPRDASTKAPKPNLNHRTGNRGK